MVGGALTPPTLKTMFDPGGMRAEENENSMVRPLMLHEPEV
jgi:hypothetical protein